MKTTPTRGLGRSVRATTTRNPAIAGHPTAVPGTPDTALDGIAASCAR